MFKRTRGYLLLTLLVLTGLAGRMHTEILSGKERRLLLNELKSSSTALVLSTEGLSKKQINFKSIKNKRSIFELVCELANIENSLLHMSQKTMHDPQEHKNLTAVKDGELEGIATDLTKDPKRFGIECTSFKSLNAALASYHAASSTLLRYSRTTTENVRGRVVHTAGGNMDAYQLMLLSGKCTAFYIAAIEATKHTQNFPK